MRKDAKKDLSTPDTSLHGHKQAQADVHLPCQNSETFAATLLGQVHGTKVGGQAI